MKTNRIGKATEYKRGHYYLTIVEWPDGHYEIEIHHCCPELVYHSCDIKDREEAEFYFEKLVDREKKCLPILKEIPKLVTSSES